MVKIEILGLKLFQSDSKAQVNFNSILDYLMGKMLL